MRLYYSVWNGNERRFYDPIVYDHTFPVKFPNIVLTARDLKEANEKIKTINSRMNRKDRFDLNLSKIRKLAF